MKCSYFAGTKEAQTLVIKLQRFMNGELLPVSEVRSVFGRMDILVFIMAAGIVTRLLAPIVEKGAAEPAVIVIDQKGKYVIPVLSGHLGAANEYAYDLAKYLGAQAVITTATDMEKVLSFEYLAKRNNLLIENHSAVKQISSLLLQGARVVLHTDHDIELESAGPDRDSLKILHYGPEDERAIVRGYHTCVKTGEPAVFLTSRMLLPPENGIYPPNILIMRSRDIVVGIGSRSLVNEEYVYQALKTALDRQNLPESAVIRLATIPLMGKEPAVAALSRRLQVPVELIDAEDIRKVDYLFISSPFAQKVTSVGNVSAPCAYLSAGKGRMLLVRATYPGGVTLAIAQEKRTILL